VLRVATHSGTFHADDAFAVAVLRLAHPDTEVQVVRTRDRATQAAQDVRIDVGHRFDPAAGDFDHHQHGGAGRRAGEDGVPYASFGLVWAHHGPAIAAAALADGNGGAPVAADVAQLVEGVDRWLVAPIDANDVGVQLTAVREDGLAPYAVSAQIAALNPSWDEPSEPADEDAAFEQAVEIAELTLRRELARGAAGLRARARVHAALERSADPRLLELEQDVPWVRIVVEQAPEVLFVLYPKRDGWGVRAVPARLGEFANRKDLPEAWAGLEGEALAAVTGVPDSVFCHQKRFLAVAGSHEGAVALARQAIEA
jgi:uncharacterized UPF0160 family protein